MNVIDRFLKYVSFDTESDEFSSTCPSTDKQKVLGAALVEEMKAMGIADAFMDENGYVYGTVPGDPELPTIGLIAHMDTSPACSGADIKAKIVEYTGEDVCLNEEQGIMLSAKDYPYLNGCVGKHLIVTDGTTLLGADDKAGIAEILACAEYLLTEKPRHATLKIGFTPDEEIGRGADEFDVDGFEANYAYTVDGGELGEIEYENFNAASARITVHGVNIHPGAAKNKMKNAVLMAADFIARMPVAETPAHTEGYEGFYHISDIVGNETEAAIAMLIRDHDWEKFQARKAFVAELAAYLNRVYGEGTFTAEIKDSYYNMKEQLLPHMDMIDNAKAAMLAAGVEPKIVAIRGGTDGARLSYMGLPCPNLSTGGVNFHSVREMVSVQAMEKMVKVLLYLVSPESR